VACRFVQLQTHVQKHLLIPIWEASKDQHHPCDTLGIYTCYSYLLRLEETVLELLMYITGIVHEFAAGEVLAVFKDLF